MSVTPNQLPNSIEEMKQLFLAQAANLEKLNAELEAAKSGLIAYALEIEKLKFQLARLRRQKFGSSSERIDREIGQLELRLEELEATKAQAEAKAEAAAPAAAAAAKPAAAKPKKPRRKFPEHLPRTTVVHEPTECPTSGCDGRLRKVGEDVTPVLKYIPGPFVVGEQVREHGAGAYAGVTDPARGGGCQPAGARGDRQVLRSSPALPAIRDLRPRRRRARPFAARRLDGKGGVAVGSGRPKDCRTRHGRERDPRR